MANSSKGGRGQAVPLPGRRLVRAGFVVLAVAVLAVDVGYFFLVRGQDDAGEISARVVFFLGFLVLSALLIVAVPVVRGRWPVRLAVAAISGLTLTGVLAIFSIGVALLLIAICALALLIGLVAGEPNHRPGHDHVGNVLAGMVPVLVLVVGLLLT